MADDRDKHKKITIRREDIPSVPLQDAFGGNELADLQDMGVSAVNINTFERGVMQQVDKAMEMENESAHLKRMKDMDQQIRQTQDALLTLAVPRKPANYEFSAKLKRKYDKELERVRTLRHVKTKKLEDLRNSKELLVHLHAHDKRTAGAEELDLVSRGEQTPFHSVEGASRPVSQAYAVKKKLQARMHKTMSGATYSDEQIARSDLMGRSTMRRIASAPAPFQVSRKPMKQRGPPMIDDDAPDGAASTYVRKKRKRAVSASGTKRRRVKAGGFDDGDEMAFRVRMREHRQEEKRAQHVAGGGAEEDELSAVSSEDGKPPRVRVLDDDIVFEGGLRIPSVLYERLFGYQKTGVRWMWELHCQNAGGIVGDEMGLGKTVQMIAFLAALKYSGLFSTAVVVCPATVMQQWVREFHKWWPEFRVVVVHSAGSYSGDLGDVIDTVAAEGGVIVTTYEGVRIHQEALLEHRWEYIILDEGHKIRNPDAEITLVCKQFMSPHRLILSGSPIQNSLKELWALFDFVFPGKLGTLPVFQAQFAVPINMGGYSNATAVQVQTAYKCACVLRDLISPYLLRRMKVDVNPDLPSKNEQVLFCRLTPEQRDSYMAFLRTEECKSILAGKRKVFYGIDVLRKICNHPDLLFFHAETKPEDYGSAERSGKLKVVARLLETWKEQGHKTLVFFQTRQMLDIIEAFLVGEGHNYRRMDGGTPIKVRQTIIDEFNNDPSVTVFILTSKTGGVGTNLTGANKVILFDPDWNPQTDIQARERAWRIGQKREVAIYRLMTSGTIEEKIYHKQIFKTFLSNKILKDPRQKRFFKTNDLRDLFTLSSEYSDKKTFGEGTETGDIFSHINAETTKDEEGSSSDGEAEDPTVKSDDKYILCQLFNETNMHSMLDHDQIMDAGAGAERIVIEHEADKIAKRAAAALRASRMRIGLAEEGVPTWTGRSGEAGLPERQDRRKRFGRPRPTPVPAAAASLDGAPPQGAAPAPPPPSSRPGGDLFGTASGPPVIGTSTFAQGESQEGAEMPSSSDLMAAMRTRASLSQGAEAEDAVDVGEMAPADVLAEGNREALVVELRALLLERGGRAGTREIVEYFKLKLDPSQVAVLRALLREIATFKKDTKTWVLDHEFV